MTIYTISYGAFAVGRHLFAPSDQMVLAKDYSEASRLAERYSFETGAPINCIKLTGAVMDSAGVDAAIEIIKKLVEKENS